MCLELVGCGIALGDQVVAEVAAEEGVGAARVRHRHYLDRQVRYVVRERAEIKMHERRDSTTVRRFLTLFFRSSLVR